MALQELPGPEPFPQAWLLPAQLCGPVAGVPKRPAAGWCESPLAAVSEMAEHGWGWGVSGACVSAASAFLRVVLGVMCASLLLWPRV